MLRIRRGNCCTNQGESRRIYPARQTSSTLCCLSAATTSRSCSVRGLSLDGMAAAVRPRCRAVAIPGASALLEMTTAMRAFAMRPASMLSAMATKFEPRPERRMPSECIVSVVYYFALAFDDAADGDAFLSHALQHRLSFLEFCQRHHQQHAQAHVESTKHFVLRNIA